MSILSLVWSEIIHRKLSFLVALMAIVLAVATCVAVATIWEGYESRTDARVAKLDDEIRKVMKNMGFNITILPKGLNLGDFYTNDFAEKTMPFEYVERLANSPDVITINHLRPALIQKVDWPERKRSLLLMGVSGVVPFSHRDPKKPLSEPVAPGVIHLGQHLARQLDLATGSSVRLLGKEFTVGKVYDERGSKDDITAWIDLTDAQTLLKMPDRINMIQALECNCASLDRLGDIQREIGAILGDDVQVIEQEGIATARAKTRNEVKAAGRATLSRLAALSERLLPLLTIGTGLVVGLLAFSNVRERRPEIGLLRAIGLRSRQILALFLTKGAVLGIVGGFLGYLLGFAIGGVWSGYGDSGTFALFRPSILMTAIFATPILVMAACWLPAVVATKQDPAVVLREE